MNILSLPLDVIQLFVNMLDWRSALKLSMSSKRLYKLFNERFWKAKRLDNFPDLEIPKRAPIRQFYLKINTRCAKAPKFNYGEYLVDLHNYLLFYSDININSIIDKICGKRISSANLSTDSNISNSMAPYFWKEVFININKYLSSEGKELLKERSCEAERDCEIQRARRIETEKINLKYKDVCVEYITKVKEDSSQKKEINNRDIKLIAKYVKNYNRYISEL